MTISLPLEKMTRAEKLRVMNEIWADLAKEPDELESPAWHAQVLNETEARYRAGIEVPIDWEQAKNQLLAKIGK